MVVNDLKIWLSDRPDNPNDHRCLCFGRNGKVNAQYPYAGCGVRPVCSINGDAPVTECGAGGLYCQTPQNLGFSDKELSGLLGV